VTGRFSLVNLPPCRLCVQQEFSYTGTWAGVVVLSPSGGWLSDNKPRQRLVDVRTAVEVHAILRFNPFSSLPTLLHSFTNTGCHDRQKDQR
jgi:hypothetical protein